MSESTWRCTTCRRKVRWPDRVMERLDGKLPRSQHMHCPHCERWCNFWRVK